MGIDDISADAFDPEKVAAELRHAGYTDKDGQSLMGSYRLLEGGIEIRPGPDSYHSPEPATIRIREGKVEAISSKTGDLEAYELEPQMITSLFDAEQRSRYVPTNTHFQGEIGLDLPAILHIKAGRLLENVPVGDTKGSTALVRKPQQ